jgi:hypothetical protein
MNAQFAQFQAQMFTSLAKMDAGQSGINLTTSPSVPTFTSSLWTRAWYELEEEL